MNYILVTARPTPGDDDFYFRWRAVGNVFIPTDPYEPEKINILVCDFRSPLTEGFSTRLKGLKYVCTATTGLDHIQVNATTRGIRVVSLTNETSFLLTVDAVAQYTMGKIFQLARPDDGIGMNLRGKLLGIVGHGRIGHQLSVKASSEGMRVFHVDKNSADWEWKHLFSKSDFVSLHLPGGEETKGIIGKELLNQMKKTAYLINTARETVLDEIELKAMLHTGKIAGAVLDVTSNDWSDLRNVIVTDHIAGNTFEDRVATDKFIVEKMQKLLGVRRVKETSLGRGMSLL